MSGRYARPTVCIFAKCSKEKAEYRQMSMDNIVPLRTRKSPETLILLGFPGCIGLPWMMSWW
jgi:hypothetical protein